MTFNTTNSSTKHAKSLVQKLRADKVLPFTDVLSAKSIANKINNLNYRERIFSPDLTIYGFLSQAINADPSCQAAVSQIITHLISQGFDAPSANTSGYSQARSRLPQEILSDLAKEAAHELEKNIPNNWLWRNRNVKLVDGTTLSMPDTAANQNAYPQLKSQKTGVGFSILRLVGIFLLATGSILDCVFGPYSGRNTGEHALLCQLLHNFNEGDVMLADAGFCSYLLIATMIAMKIDIVFPQNASRKTDFRKGAALGKNDHIMQWSKPNRPA
jgi:hypothetical protein